MAQSRPLSLVLAAVHIEAGAEAVPLGAASVASAIKSVFPAISLSFVETFLEDGAALTAEKIKTSLAAAGGTCAAGFSLYCWNRFLVLDAARAVRSALPDVFLFCGGPEATALPEGLGIETGGPFDAVVRGEGEKAAVRLIGERFFGWAAGAPGTVFEDLASLPSPWLDRTLKVRGAVLWELSRGCPYHCFYCYESKGEEKPRYFPESRLREECRLFVREGASYVFVLDPTFNSNAHRALRLLDMIEEESRAGPVHWHFEVRGELITRSQARRFARIGASLQIGLQTADLKVSALIGRVLDLKRFSSRIAILNEENVVFGLDLIYGLPGDTLDGFKKSLDFALSLYPNTIDLFRLSALPGTVLAEKAAEYGIEAEGRAPYLVHAVPGFSPAELDEAERLSKGADFFYNTGRAVGWFNQVLLPLRMKPSAFLAAFTEFAGAAGFSAAGDSPAAEKAQLAFLETIYLKKNKAKIIPAVRDIVRYHGAWGRSLVDGIKTEINFTYDPDLLLSEAALDLDRFTAAFKPCSRKLTI
jgi:hypothetical protein